MSNPEEKHQEYGEPSTSQPSPAVQQDLIPAPEMGLRVTQAEFARIMGVTRQTVTKWKAAGKIHPDLDGRFCPKRAASSILKSTDPNKIRARILKDAAEDAARLRAEVENLTRIAEGHEVTIFQLRRVISRLEQDQAEADRQMEIAPAMLSIRWDDLNEMGEDERTRAIAEVLDDALLSASSQIATEASARALGLDPDGPGAAAIEKGGNTNGDNS